MHHTPITDHRSPYTIHLTPQAWGNETLHPPDNEVGVVRGFTDAKKTVHGTIASDGTYAKLAAVDFSSRGFVGEYRIGFCGQNWLALEPATSPKAKPLSSTFAPETPGSAHARGGGGWGCHGKVHTF